MDPYFFIGPWIPIFGAVRRSHYSEPFVDPFIQSGLWFSIFRSVRGSLYSGRFMDPFIQFSPWIPILIAVRGSVFLYLFLATKIKKIKILAKIDFKSIFKNWPNKLRNLNNLARFIFWPHF